MICFLRVLMQLCCVFFFFLVQRLQQELKENPGSHPFDEVLSSALHVLFFMDNCDATARSKYLDIKLRGIYNHIEFYLLTKFNPIY